MSKSSSRERLSARPVPHARRTEPPLSYEGDCGSVWKMKDTKLAYYPHGLLSCSSNLSSRRPSYTLLPALGSGLQKRDVLCPRGAYSLGRKMKRALNCHLASH